MPYPDRTIHAMRVTSREILSDEIAPTLRRMTAPMIAGILAMMAFGATDTWFLSLLGTDALAAISFTFPVTYTVMNLSIGMGIATSVMLARVIGRRQAETARRTCTDCLYFSVLVVAVLAMAELSTIDPLFRALGATELTLPLIHDYMVIWYLSIGLLVIPMVGNAAIRATGDTRWPSLMMIASGLLNAVLDPLLIFGIGPFPRLEMQGAALATAISWLIAFILAFWLLEKREHLLTRELPARAELLATWKRLIRIGTPVSIANMLTPISIMLVTALIARESEIAVAGYGAGARIESFAIVIALAMTSTLSPFMAQNLGANQLLRARAALALSVRFILKLQIGAWIVLALCARPLAALFSDDPQVLEVAVRYLWIMPAGAAMYCLVILFNTAFNAAHESGKTLLLCCLRLFAFILPCAWLGGVVAGVTGILWGSVAGNAMAAAVGLRMVRRLFARLEAAPATMDQT